MNIVTENTDNCHVFFFNFISFPGMKRILVIEDNSDIRENVSELLELSGYHVLTAENGKSGVEVATCECPDIILCDVMMPLLNGMEVLEILKSNDSTRNIPFVFLTSFSEQREVEEAMRKGATAYLVKPFEEDELYTTIKTSLGIKN